MLRKRSDEFVVVYIMYVVCMKKCVNYSYIYPVVENNYLEMC